MSGRRGRSAAARRRRSFVPVTSAPYSDSHAHPPIVSSAPAAASLLVAPPIWIADLEAGATALRLLGTAEGEWTVDESSTDLVELYQEEWRRGKGEREEGRRWREAEIRVTNSASITRSKLIESYNAGE